MIRIDKNIPIPPKVYRGRPSRYPFADMAIGDSFATEHTHASKISPSCAHATKTLGFKFSVRKQADGTIRVWRIA